MKKRPTFLERWLAPLRTALRALSAPAADPRALFADGFRRQSELLETVQLALSELAVTRDYLANKTDELSAVLPKFEDLAAAALDEGREDLAWEVLERQVIAGQELDRLAQESAQIHAEERRLARIEEKLVDHIEAFVAEQDVLLARYSAAEAQLQINTSIQEASRELARMNADLAQVAVQTRQMQARVADIDRLVGGEAVDEALFSGRDALWGQDRGTVRERAQERLKVLQQKRR